MPDLTPFVKILKDGGIVGFPTETVYGLGADAWNPEAIQKIFQAKDRPADNPLIVHISDEKQVNQFAENIPEAAKKLMKKFWPGPLTLVLNKRHEVLDSVTAGLPTVALRMPSHPVALNLIRQAGALAAPSANTSGKPSPTKADHVKDDMGMDFPVIDGGATEVGLESTVVGFDDDKIVILRPGKIGARELEASTGLQVINEPTPKEEKPRSPGQKYSHYKPKAKVVYKAVAIFNKHTLYLMQTATEIEAENIINYHGDLKKLSRELYDRFRQADHLGYTQIHIEPIEDYKNTYPAYYEALMNRIKKTLG